MGGWGVDKLSFWVYNIDRFRVNYLLIIKPQSSAVHFKVWRETGMKEIKAEIVEELRQLISQIAFTCDGYGRNKGDQKEGKHLWVQVGIWAQMTNVDHKNSQVVLSINNYAGGKIPISGIPVELTPKSGKVQRATTDSIGYCTFHYVPPEGEYEGVLRLAI